MADPTPTDPTPTPDPQPTPTPPAPPTPPADPPVDPDDGKGGKDAILADLAKERDKRQALEQTVSEMQTAQQAQMDAFAKALGLKPEDAPADPAELAKQVTAEQGKTANAERQLAVFKLAADPEVGANAAALLDSSSFLASIAEIDPTDETKLTEAITAAIEKNPIFKASQTPSAPPFPGGPRPPAPTRAGSLGEAISNKLAATRTS